MFIVKENQATDSFKQNRQTGRNSRLQCSRKMNSSSFDVFAQQKWKKTQQEHQHQQGTCTKQYKQQKAQKKSTRAPMAKQVDSPICQNPQKVADSGSTCHTTCK